MYVWDPAYTCKHCENVYSIKTYIEKGRLGTMTPNVAKFANFRLLLNKIAEREADVSKKK